MKPKREKTEHEPAPLWPFLLIVIVVAAFMVYILYMEFNPASPPQSQCTFLQWFTCMSYKLHSGSGELDLKIVQKTGITIQVNGVVCTQNEIAPSVINNYAANPIKITSGSAAFVSQSGTSHAVRCTDVNGNPLHDTSAGTLYQGKVYMNYSNLAEGGETITNGTFQAEFES